MVSDVLQPKWQMQLVLIGFLGSSRREPWPVSLNSAHSFDFCWWFLEVSQGIVDQNCWNSVKVKSHPLADRTGPFVHTKDFSLQGCHVWYSSLVIKAQKKEKESAAVDPSCGSTDLSCQCVPWSTNTYLYVYISLYCRIYREHGRIQKWWDVSMASKNTQICYSDDL